jgi:RHS repeat-associated protein
VLRKWDTLSSGQGCTNLPFGDGWSCTGSVIGNNGFASLINNPESTTNEADNRQQTPTQGRWLTPDPAGLAAVDPTNPQTWNRYAYVGNSPVSYNDPSGLKRLPPGPNPGPGMYVGGYNFGCETQSECDFFNPFSYYAAYYLSQFSQAAGANVMMNGVGGFLCGEAEIPDDIPCGFPGGASIGDILGIPHPSGCEFGSCGPSIGSPFHTEPDGTVVGDFPGEVLCPPGWPCTAWNPDLQEWGAYDPSSCLSSASSDRFWCRAIWGSAYAIPAGLVDFGCLDVGGPAAEIWCNNVAQGALGAPVLLGLHGCSTNYAGAVNRCYNPQTGTGH